MCVRSDPPMHVALTLQPGYDSLGKIKIFYPRLKSRISLSRVQEYTIRGYPVLNITLAITEDVA